MADRDERECLRSCIGQIRAPVQSETVSASREGYLRPSDPLRHLYQAVRAHSETSHVYITRVRVVLFSVKLPHIPTWRADGRKGCRTSDVLSGAHHDVVYPNEAIMAIAMISFVLIRILADRKCNGAQMFAAV